MTTMTKAKRDLRARAESDSLASATQAAAEKPVPPTNSPPETAPEVAANTGRPPGPVEVLVARVLDKLAAEGKLSSAEPNHAHPVNAVVGR